jgi:uncharacterized protein (TIGR04255 family)
MAGSGVLWSSGLGALLTKPPLAEAVIEIRYPALEPTDLPAGTLRRELATDYPIASSAFSAELGPQTVARLSVGFETSDRTHQVRLGPGAYRGWAAFVAEFERVRKMHCALTNPTAVGRIGVRYVNRLSPESGRELGDYVTVGFAAPNVLVDDVTDFGLMIKRDVESLPGSLLYQLRTIGDGVLLDLDVSTTRITFTPADDQAIQQWLNSAHDLLERAFLDSLAPAYRKEIT